jgi:hypothetical protein
MTSEITSAGAAIASTQGSLRQTLGDRIRVDGSSLRQSDRLEPQERRELEELKQRDREVRAHEAAHQAAAGGHAQGGASFSYQRGPDGRLYAVGGEVSIDTSKVAGDPEATLRKAQEVQRAAMAPAEPSSQDRQVAAEAAAMAMQARMELAKEARGPDLQPKPHAQLQRRIMDSGALDTRAPRQSIGLHMEA